MAVEYFISNFPHLFQDIDVNLLAEQFIAYQVLPDDAVPLSVKTDLGLKPDDPHRVDALWGWLLGLQVSTRNKSPRVRSAIQSCNSCPDNTSLQSW